MLSAQCIFACWCECFRFADEKINLAYEFVIGLTSRQLTMIAAADLSPTLCTFQKTTIT